jgi:phosphatidylserine decarboxylase
MDYYPYFTTAAALGFISFMHWFVRKPIRENIHRFKIVSPCDGKITSVDKNKISVFLSLFDVHWQYVPMDACIKSIDIIHGSHKMATNPKSSHNEGIKVVFHSELGDITVTQRVGFFVRRIQNTIQSNQWVNQSGPYGIIRFGSRVDIVLPEKLSTSHLKIGDKLIGGVSGLIL